MWKPLLAASAAALALAGPGAGAASRAAAGPLPTGWTHAEINYVSGGAPHTLVLDRGRVTAVSPTSLTLREADGSTQQIQLAPATQVIVDGRPGTLADIRRLAFVTTQRVDGGPATRVREHLPPRLLRRR